MTLHGDRPSEPRSGSQSPANATSVAGAKRAASHKQDSAESVKRTKNDSDSPARRTVIEVLNTPNVDSPVPKMDSTNGTEGSYFKSAESKKTSATPDPPKSGEETTQAAAAGPEVPIPDVAETAVKEDVEIPAAAEPSRPDTPPMDAPSAPVVNEDVVMAEPDAPTDLEPVSAPTPAAAAAPAPSSESQAEAATEAIGTTTTPVVSIEPVKATITESAPATVEASEPVTSNTTTDAVEAEKKDQ